MDPYTEERAIIDQEITELTQRLYVLKLRRNHLAPVSRLPPELLIRIFFAFQSEQADDSTYYQWTVITQVTSEWRQLILETPSLWGKIVQQYSMNLSQWAVTSFARSGAAALEVHAPYMDMKDSVCEFLCSVLSEMHRVRTLDIGILDDGDANRLLGHIDNLTRCLEKPAPILQEVKLKTWYESSIINPNPPFGGNAPALRGLDLCRVRFDFTVFPVQNLTSLVLGSFDSRSEILFNEFLDALSTTHQLQVLQIDKLHLQEDDTSYTRRATIPLRSLTSLTAQFHEHWHIFIAFFTVVSIPSRTKIRITAWHSQVEEEAWSSFFQLFSRCFIDGPVGFGRIDVTLTSSIDCSIEFWEENSSNKPPLLRFVFIDSVVLRAVAQAIRYLPVTQLHSLSFRQHKSGNDIDAWDLPDFDLLPALRSLKINGPWVEWFLDHFQEIRSSLPTLEILEVELHGVEDVEARLKMLRHVIEKWRKEGGGNLKELKLDASGISTSYDISELLAPLEEFVEVKVAL